MKKYIINGYPVKAVYDNSLCKPFKNPLQLLSKRGSKAWRKARGIKGNQREQKAHGSYERLPWVFFIILVFPIIQRRGVRKSHLDFSEGRAGDRAGSESGRNSRGISGQRGII